MTKEQLEAKLADKRKELNALQESHTRMVTQNQQKGNELNGAIAVLEEILKAFEAQPPPPA